jgi:hypothetical protein
VNEILCGHPIPEDSWRGPDGVRVFCQECQAVRLVRTATNEPLPGQLSVGGLIDALEDADPRAIVGLRTDEGVHALNTFVDVDGPRVLLRLTD